jgi:hypothetical protein
MMNSLTGPALAAAWVAFPAPALSAIHRQSAAAGPEAAVKHSEKVLKFDRALQRFSSCKGNRSGAVLLHR